MHEAQRIGGSRKSKAKTAAARANGAKGGRPRQGPVTAKASVSIPLELLASSKARAAEKGMSLSAFVAMSLKWGMEWTEPPPPPEPPLPGDG